MVPARDELHGHRTAVGSLYAADPARAGSVPPPLRTFAAKREARLAGNECRLTRVYRGVTRRRVRYIVSLVVSHSAGQLRFALLELSIGTVLCISWVPAGSSRVALLSRPPNGGRRNSRCYLRAEIVRRPFCSVFFRQTPLASRGGDGCHCRVAGGAIDRNVWMGCEPLLRHFRSAQCHERHVDRSVQPRTGLRRKFTAKNVRR